MNDKMTAPIAIAGVWKSFGATQAVRGLSLEVTARTVFGFLGPNGAGKSTTIRMILGLQRPDRGQILLFGKPLEADRMGALARVGALVEAPSLYLHLTGRENLEVHRRLLGARTAAIDEALETVRLTGAANRAVRGYSTGMKQRLGIAQALLGKPDLLLLDEPTNGLDPAGIHEVRSLIRELPDRQGATIFLSSHLLAEVEQVATHLAILSAGQARFTGTADELRRRNRPQLVADVDEPERAAGVLRQAGLAVSVGVGQIRMDELGGFAPAAINAMLVRAGIGVAQFAWERPSLEEAFLNLTEATEGAPQ